MPRQKKPTAAGDPLAAISGDQFRFASYASVHFMTDPKPQPVSKLYKWYTDHWGAELRWLVDSVTERHRPFVASEANAMLGRWIRGARGSGDFLWASFGGETHHAVSEWLVEGTLDLAESCSLQMSWPVGKTWDEHLARALKAFDVPLDFGYGGLGLTWPVHDGGWDRTHVPVHDQLLRRFSGVDPLDSLFHSSLKGIRTPGWLTAIGHHHIDRLPRNTLASLPKEIVSHRLPHCIVLQLGPAPKLGDANAKEDMSLYRAAMAALKPLRDPNTWHWLGNYMYKSPDWMARFD